MISAFGPRAQRYAQRLDPSLHAIVTEDGFISEAYLEAVVRRERGTPFYGMILLDDRRSALAGAITAQILQATPNHEARFMNVAAYAAGDLPIGGTPVRQIWAIHSGELLFVAREFFALSEAMLVRSFAEAERWTWLVQRLRPFERVLCEPAIPDVCASAGAVGVVVWGADEPAEQLAVPALGLADFRGPVTVVCAGGSLPGLPNATFLTPNDPAVEAALASAAVVVCPDVGDPGAAVAFAHAGFGVVAAVTSGAIEFLPEVAIYDAATPRAVFEAVRIAFARAPLRLPVREAIPPIPLPSPAPVTRESLPLVSIVITTYNRPDDLRHALASAAAQTYPNVEILVVNDAGSPVDDIVAAVPNARLHNRPENGGIDAAVSTGYSLARGEFVLNFADDDHLYPDHVERLAFALLRSGAGAAHANALIRYQKRAEDGRYVTIGFNAEVFNSSTTMTEALITTPIACQSILFRRDFFNAVGGWTNRTFLADQDLQLRVWQQSPVVWVDHVTNEWRVREKGATFSTTAQSGPELRRLFDLHPVAGRPLLEQQREVAVSNLSAREVGAGFPPTITLNRND